MRILSFDEYKIFEFLYTNPHGSTGTGTTDLSLSSYPYERGKQHFQYAVSSLIDYNKRLKVNGMFNSFKLNNEPIDIEKYVVLRILQNSGKYNAYISFDLGGVNYWGVIEDIMSKTPEFNSEIFTDNYYKNKEVKIKLNGLILKIFFEWFKPQKGRYKSLKDNIDIFDTNTGVIFNLKLGEYVMVKRIFNNEIILTHGDQEYYMRGDNYVYFNYWFEKIN